MSELIAVVHLHPLGGAPGTTLKIDGITTNRIDRARAAAFIKAAR